MKNRARSYVWWPGLDSNVEELVKSCPQCQEAKSAPPKAPLYPWVWPSRPWERIHVDFAGPFLGKSSFIVVDAHSKWPEVIPMSTTTSLATVAELTRPDLESIVAKKQFEQKGHYDGAATLRQFVEGQWVLVRNFRKGPKWVPAIVRQKSGPLSYVVQLTPTISWRRHVDQMRVCSDSPYWHETVASSPTDKSGVPTEVEKRPMEEEERMTLLQTNRLVMWIPRDQWSQEQKYPRLKIYTDALCARNLRNL
ncbi:hypothetical protein EMCRGX_G027446 [Ephydatia muelleri]